MPIINSTGTRPRPLGAEMMGTMNAVRGSGRNHGALVSLGVGAKLLAKTLFAHAQELFPSAGNKGVSWLVAQIF